MALVALHRRTQIVGESQIRMESKGTVEGSCRALDITARIVTEFSEEMADTAESHPRRGIVRALFHTLKVKVAGQAHAIQRPRKGELVGARLIFVASGT